MRLKMRQPLVSGFGTGERLAQTLSCIIQGRPYTDEVPYRVEPGNEGRWVLDEGNNWRLTICTDQIIEISCRHNGEDVLLPWLKYRYGMEEAPQTWSLYDLLEDGKEYDSKMDTVFEHDAELGYLTINGWYPYHIELARIKSKSDLLGWASHLDGKPWMLPGYISELIDRVCRIKKWPGVQP